MSKPKTIFLLIQNTKINKYNKKSEIIDINKIIFFNNNYIIIIIIIIIQVMNYIEFCCKFYIIQLLIKLFYYNNIKF